MLNLRPYQQDAVEATLEGFALFDRQLGVAPTGAGKTIMFSHLAKRTLPGRTLILAHREELIDQAIAKARSATGIYAQKEKAEFRASLSSEVVVASVQTMIKRLHKWPHDHFSLVVADEAHHAISDSWQKVLRHFSVAKVLGVTATPDRLDKQDLGKYFENVAFEIKLFDLIDQGYLSRICAKSVPLQIDISKVRQTAGDYNEADLGSALIPYLREIAQSIREYATFRRTLVFLPLIATSMAFVEICKEEGIAAAHIDGMSSDRKEILERFESGEFDVLSNAMLLTEGFDSPLIDCVVILRPTRSRSLYSQMVGRGTRVALGKENLLLLDFLWLHEKHSLIRPAHLVASSEEIAKEMTETVEDAAEKVGYGGNQIEFDLQILDTETRRQREEKLKEELKRKASRQARSVDAVEFCLSLKATETAQYEPVTQADSQAVTDGQRKYLESQGVDVSSVKTKGHASKIIDLILSRQHLELATPKQVMYLRQFGYPHPDTVSSERASELLSRYFRGAKPKHTIRAEPASAQ